MSSLSESTVEEAVLEWLAGIGWQVTHGSAYHPSCTDKEYDLNMATKGVFISYDYSFDYYHDNDLRGNLVSQAKNPESPFSITDWSVRHRIEENWRREVRDRIRSADLTIVICGEHTPDAPGVAAEITITREEGKPYFLLQGRRRKTCTKPAMVLSTDEVHSWTWDNLRRLIAGTR